MNASNFTRNYRKMQKFRDFNSFGYASDLTSKFFFEKNFKKILKFKCIKLDAQSQKKCKNLKIESIRLCIGFDEQIFLSKKFKKKI